MLVSPVTIELFINRQANVKYPLATQTMWLKKKEEKMRTGGEEWRRERDDYLPPFWLRRSGLLRGDLVSGSAQWLGPDPRELGQEPSSLKAGKKKCRLWFTAGKNYNSLICMLKWKDIRYLRRQSFITSQRWCWRNVDPHPAGSLGNSSIRRVAIGWGEMTSLLNLHNNSVSQVCIILNMHV